MADGNIELGIGLKADEVVNEAKALSKKLDAILNSSGSSDNKKLQSLVSQIKSVQLQSEKLNQKLQKIGSNDKATPEFENLTKQIAEADSKVAELESKIAKMYEGFSDSQLIKTSEYQELQKALDAAERLEQKKAEMIRNGEAYNLGVDSTDYQNTLAQMDILNTKMQMIEAKYGELGDSSEHSVKRQESGLNKLSNACISVDRALNKVGATIKKVFGALTSPLRNAFNNISKGTRGIHLDIGRLLKSGGLLLIGARSIFSLFRNLVGEVKTGMGELATKFPSINKQLSETKALSSQLRGSFVSAFQPIISAVLPWLNALIATLNTAIEALGRFFATLTGQGFYYKATKSAQEYAGALGSASKEAKNLTSGIDELNILNAESGGGGGSGGGGSDAWERVGLESGSKLAEMIKNAWQDGDFTEIGKILGGKLKLALDSIDWDDIQQNARKVAHSLATLINGFFSTEGLAESIGTTLAEGINTAIDALDEFASTIEWKKIGSFINESIKTFLTKTDFKEAGKALFKLIGGGLDLAIEATDDDETWKLAGQAIADFIANLKWDEIFKKSLELAKNILGGIGLALVELIPTVKDPEMWKNVGTAIGEFLASDELKTAIGSVVELGKAILDGIFISIGAAIDAKYNLPEGTGKKIAEALAIGGLVGEITLKLIPSITNLIEHFKKKDKALEEQTKKTGEETAAVKDMGTAFEGAGVSAIVATVGISLLGSILSTIPSYAASSEASLQEFSAQSQTTAEESTAAAESINTGFSKSFDSLSARILLVTIAISEHIKSMLNESKTNITTFVAETSKSFSDWASNVATNASKSLSAVSQSVYDGLTNAGTNTINFINSSSTAVANWSNNIAENAGKGIKAFVNNIADGLQKAWENFKDFAKATGDAISGTFSKVNWGAVALAGAAAVAAASIALVPVTGGASLAGLAALADGAVLPPNKPFLAMVGDQTHGTNIEAPLDIIKQAVAEVIGGGYDSQILDALLTLIDVVDSKDLTVKLSGKDIENESRSVRQRRGAVIATGGLVNYS